MSRTSKNIILQQHRMFEQHVCFAFFEALPGGIFVLNANREIVYLHPRSKSLVPHENINDCLGMRMGEALGCVNAHLGKEGCNTSRFCTYCGSAKALRNSDKHGEGHEECNLIRQIGENLESLCLEVLAVRVESHGECYCVFSVQDQTERKELLALERFFFHDVLNLAGGVRSMLEIMTPQLAHAGDAVAQTLKRATNRLVDEIVVQRKLSEGLRDELATTSEQVRSERMGEDLVWLYQGYWPNGPRIEMDAGFERVVLETDRALLERVLGNMIKNAAEASARDQVVTLGCTRNKDGVRLWVRNEDVLPKKVRNQIFHNSFSTKGKGRGLGTHSMKLLGERYLGGRVDFESAEGLGTIFFVELAIEKS